LPNLPAVHPNARFAVRLEKKGCGDVGHLRRWSEEELKMKKLPVEMARKLFADKTDDQIREHATAVGIELSETDARGGKQKTDGVTIQRKIQSVLLLVNRQVDRDYADREDQKVFHLGVLLNGLKSICEKHGLNPDVVMSDDIVKNHIDKFTPENLPSLNLEKVSRVKKVADSNPASEEAISNPTSDTVENTVLDEAV